jgi:hypothetical protein
MPAVLKIDPQRRIVVSAFFGYVTGPDLLSQQSKILDDPHFQSNFADLTDLSLVSVADIDDGVLTKLAGTRSVFDSDVPHVIVAPADLPYEKAVKYRELARDSRRNLHVVRTLGEARELLAKLGYE